MPVQFRRGLIASLMSGILVIATWIVLPTLAEATTCTSVATQQELIDISSDLSGDYCLTSDITLDSDWTPLMGSSGEAFTGKFDGQDHKISGLKINKDLYVGLFAKVGGNAVIKNLILDGAEIQGQEWVGTLAGYVSGYSAINNVHASGTVAGSDYYVGGLIGEIEGTSKANKSVTIDDTSSAVVTTSTASTVGGLIGRAMYATISNSSATGAVTGVGLVGGLVGDSDAVSISDSSATGNVTGSSSQVGGLVGYFVDDSSAVNSHATGAVQGTSYVGGLAGDLQNSNVTNAWATGGVTGSVQKVGGFAGSIEQSGGFQIARAYSTGNVTGVTRRVGGFAGYVSLGEGDLIKESFASGSVSATGYNVGGFIGDFSGYSSSTITDSFASGAVTGQFNVGGFAGSMGGAEVTSAYASGVATATGDMPAIGGFVGSVSGTTITNSFFDETVNNFPSGTPGGTGKTTSQMKSYATYSATWSISNGWQSDSDFADESKSKTWGICDTETTPYLRWFKTTAPTCSSGGGLDTTAPVLSNDSVTSITDTSATLNFTSDEAGTYYVLVLAASDSAPTAVTIKAQGSVIFNATGSPSVGTNSSVSITGLNALTSYKVYVVVRDSAGNDSSILTVDLTTTSASDTTAPLLTAGSVSSVASTTAALNFTSEEAGTYYVLVLAASDSTPTSVTIKAQGSSIFNATGSPSVGTNTSVSIAGLNASTSYKIYVVVRDAAGNDSLILTVNLRTSSAPHSGGVIAPLGPTLTVPTSPSVGAGTTTVSTLTADKPVTWSITGGSNASLFTIVDGQLRFKTDATAGTYTVEVTATDASGNVTKQLITVTVNPGPTVSVTLGPDGSASLTITDPSGGATSTKIVGTSKSGVTAVIQDGKLVVADTAFSGKVTVEVWVTGSNGAITKKFVDLTVSPKPAANVEVRGGEVSPTRVNTLVAPSSVITWSASSNALSYRVLVSGVEVGSTQETKFTLPRVIARGTKIEIIPVGNDSTFGSPTALIASATSFTVGNSGFDTNSRALTGAAKKFLDKVMASIKANGITSVSIEGHTDNVGSSLRNQALSRGRADTVKAYLQSKLPGVTFVSTASAASKPIASNKTKAGQAANRRVEIKFNN